jgi:hypothetical protein
VLYYSLSSLDSSCCGITNLTNGNTQQTITFATPTPNTDYVVSGVLFNTNDSEPSIYTYNIIEKTVNDFTVEFSSAIDSAFYYFDWILSDRPATESTPIPYNTTSFTVNFSNVAPLDYSIIPILYNEVDVNASQYLYVITEKTPMSFTILFSSAIDSTNFILDWYIESNLNYDVTQYLYSQSGGFRDFDSEGTFDCTHGFDLVQIQIDTVLPGYLLMEDGSYLLQEDGSKILL